MNKKYVLILKAGEAELRAMEHLGSDVKDTILPLIELTRGRKLPTRKGKPIPKEQFPFDRRIQRIKEIFSNQKVCLDLTSDEALMNKQILSLYNPENGYKNWVDFLIKLKTENCFKEIIPTLIIDFEDDDFEENIIGQVQALKENFSTVIYRNNISDDNCYNDFLLIKDEIDNLKLNVLIDSEYVIQSAQNQFEEKIFARVTNLKKILDPSTKFIICSTSFPNNISEIGKEKTDTFSLSEVEIFNLLRKRSLDNIIYSDYGSINPKRNDTIIMARGWIPRIDVPRKKQVFYYRQRRPKGITKYTDTYNRVAEKVVIDTRFPRNLKNNWGIRQIINCANGDSPGSSPSFWISVRMCIHVEQQVRRLGLLD